MSNYNTMVVTPHVTEALQPSIPQDHPYAWYVQALSNDMTEVCRQYANNYNQALDLEEERLDLMSCFEEVHGSLQDLDEILTDRRAQHADTVSKLAHMVMGSELLDTVIRATGTMGGWYRGYHEDCIRERDAIQFTLEAFLAQRDELRDEIVGVERTMFLQGQQLVGLDDKCVDVEERISDHWELSGDLLEEILELWGERNQWMAL